MPSAHCSLRRPINYCFVEKITQDVSSCMMTCLVCGLHVPSPCPVPMSGAPSPPPSRRRTTQRAWLRRRDGERDSDALGQRGRNLGPYLPTVLAATTLNCKRLRAPPRQPRPPQDRKGGQRVEGQSGWGGVGGGGGRG